jgi:hypothetical protein
MSLFQSDEVERVKNKLPIRFFKSPYLIQKINYKIFIQKETFYGINYPFQK